MDDFLIDEDALTAAADLMILEIEITLAVTAQLFARLDRLLIKPRHDEEPSQYSTTMGPTDGAKITAWWEGIAVELGVDPEQEKARPLIETVSTATVELLRLAGLLYRCSPFKSQSPGPHLGTYDVMNSPVPGFHELQRGIRTYLCLSPDTPVKHACELCTAPAVIVAQFLDRARGGFRCAEHATTSGVA